jgi:hypothetical protein
LASTTIRPRVPALVEKRQLGAPLVAVKADDRIEFVVTPTPCATAIRVSGEHAELRGAIAAAGLDPE